MCVEEKKSEKKKDGKKKEILYVCGGEKREGEKTKTKTKKEKGRRRKCYPNIFIVNLKW